MNTKELLYDNGFGGFSKEGKEYIICTDEENTPLPWSHIMANEKFGTIVTANGGGYVWSGNSRENKITRWSNDAIEDTPSEKLWLEEMTEDTKEINPQNQRLFLLPYDSLKGFTVSFGWGYATFEKKEKDFLRKTCIFIPRNEKKKVYQIELTNQSTETKEFFLKYQMVPVLGVAREYTKKHIQIQKREDGVMMKNFFRENYANEIVYVGTSEKITDVEEIDKVVTISVSVRLNPQETKNIMLELGVKNEETPITITQNAKELLEEVKMFWQDMTKKVKVKTPVESMNILLNGWLLYQTMVSRLWGRTSFYQAGGAFGFRDQLQDSMMMLYYDEKITKNQLIYHASHQFEEGDVLHWWHPENDSGIRTRYSDDLLWLPYVLCEYVEKTKDSSILSEEVPYAKMDLLKEDENEKYERTMKTKNTESMYMHAKRAIEKSIQMGPHGLPQMGGGDWNDGMNHVGGESVWLGFFLYEVLKRFLKLCEIMQDNSMEPYIHIMRSLKKSLNEKAWDGAWFQRAFYEDGNAIGSHESDECKIDGISQSWSVLSDAGDTEKQIKAMESLDTHLVDRENKLIKLLTPPFYQDTKNPGYIQCYIPGVRENGGQYTHGAIWSIIANSKLGNGGRAMEYYQLLNPIEHAKDKEEALLYKVEPYVMVADVYSTNNMMGRGGWTWYTGSSAWFFLAGLESILGIQKRGNVLVIKPCIPKEWEAYEVCYEYQQTSYQIRVFQQKNAIGKIKTIYQDNVCIHTNEIALCNDLKRHTIDVILE